MNYHKTLQNNYIFPYLKFYATSIYNLYSYYHIILFYLKEVSIFSKCRLL